MIHRSEKQEKSHETKSPLQVDRNKNVVRTGSYLPTLYSLVNPNDGKRLADQRRRQVCFKERIIRKCLVKRRNKNKNNILFRQKEFRML